VVLALLGSHLVIAGFLYLRRAEERYAARAEEAFADDSDRREP
jgi:hypothetical protein